MGLSIFSAILFRRQYFFAGNTFSPAILFRDILCGILYDIPTMDDPKSISDRRDRKILSYSRLKGSRLYSPEVVKDEAYYMSRANITRMISDDVRVGFHGREDKNRIDQ